MPQVQVLSPRPFFIKDVSAGVAQLVVQLICNQQVGGSSPSTSSNPLEFNMGEFPSGQRGQTVNLLSVTSVVRIHPRPPKNLNMKMFGYFFTFFHHKKKECLTGKDDSMSKMKSEILSYFWILIASILYGVGTSAFIFPCNITLGGTSGISVILTRFLSQSPGTIISILNVLLIIMAIFLLGKDMAIRSFVGSTLTTIAITGLEIIMALDGPVIANPYLSAAIGAAIIALASGIMFYCNASSGGTDIIALIVQKYRKIHIGKALLLTDILIMLCGGLLLGPTILAASCIGLLIKGFGVDFVIAQIVHMQQKQNMK